MLGHIAVDPLDRIPALFHEGIVEKANRDLRKRINGMRASFEARLKSEGHLTFEASSKIAKALHPDSAPNH